MLAPTKMDFTSVSLEILERRPFGAAHIRPINAHLAAITAHSAPTTPTWSHLTAEWTMITISRPRRMGYRPFGERRPFGQIAAHLAKTSFPPVQKACTCTAHSAENIARLKWTVMSAPNGL